MRNFLRILKIESNFLKGMIISSSIHKKKIIDTFSNPLFYFIVMLSIFIFEIQWERYCLWKKYVELNYEHNPSLIKSGTPIMFFLEENLAISYFFIPLLFAIILLFGDKSNDIHQGIVMKSTKRVNQYTRLGQLNIKALIPYILYLGLMIVISLLYGVFTQSLIYLIIQFYIVLFVLSPSILFLKYSQRLLTLGFFIALFQVFLVVVLSICFITMSTGRFNLRVIKFLYPLIEQLWFTCGPDTYHYLVPLIILSLAHPFYLKGIVRYVGRNVFE